MCATFNLKVNETKRCDSMIDCYRDHSDENTLGKMSAEVEVWVATDLSNRKSLLQQGGEFLSLDFHCRPTGRGAALNSQTADTIL